MFLDFSNPERAQPLAAAADAFFPGISVVAMQNATTAKDLMALMRLGIREVIDLPPTSKEVLHVLSQAAPRSKRTQAAGEGGGKLFAFLPAKPGVGATTLAVHTAAAAARLSTERTLLIDFDFRLGMTSFLLKLRGQHSVLDAVAISDRLDEDQWNTLVNRHGTLDVLGSAPVDFQGVDPEVGTGPLIEYARRSYRNVCVDLPGDMRDYEIDTLRRADECFLVCTPDLGSIHMAKRKVQMLKSINADQKTLLVMNRSGVSGLLPAKDIESILKLAIRFQVNNAEREIRDATEKAEVLEGKSQVAAQIESLARHLLPPQPKQAEEPKPARRFGIF